MVLAILSLVWVAALIARQYGLPVPGWTYIREPLAVSTAIFGFNALVMLLDAIKIRRHRRRVERERSAFLEAMEKGFINGRGVINRRPRP